MKTARAFNWEAHVLLDALVQHNDNQARDCLSILYAAVRALRCVSPKEARLLDRAVDELCHVWLQAKRGRQAG